jgi:hypothetical protein
MDVVREADWSTNSLCEPFEQPLNSQGQSSAFLLQCRGRGADQPCQSCAKNPSPFHFQFPEAHVVMLADVISWTTTLFCTRAKHVWISSCGAAHERGRLLGVFFFGAGRCRSAGAVVLGWELRRSDGMVSRFGYTRLWSVNVVVNSQFLDSSMLSLPCLT